jgi:AcrR family transcriptional regulator
MKRNLKVENGKKTAATLVKVAKHFFSEKGYVNTPMEEIVKEAGLTRGALYHHFGGKKGLFQAVFEDALDEINERIEKALDQSTNTWQSFISTTNTFLRACSEPEMQQIVLLDAPSILGWEVWRRVDEERTMVPLKNILTRLIEEGVIKPLPIEALSHIIGGATSEIVLWIAHSENPQKAMTEGYATLEVLYNSLRI